MIVFTVLFTLCICGTASADDSSTGGDENSILDQSQSSSLGNDQSVDPIIGVKVNYEYSSDSGINPEIKVKDTNGENIDYTKTYNNAFGGYELSFMYPGAVDGTKFDVSVSAPGYITQTKQVSVSPSLTDPTDPNLYANTDFDMKATENYKLGREVTAKADQLLNFNTADSVLAITTAGIPHRSGTTTEDCLEGILNGSGGKVSYGQGNLLVLRKTAVDPVDFCFVVRNGNALKAVFFKNSSLTPAYFENFAETMTQDYWNNVITPTLGDDSFGYVSLANAWTAGLSTDTLRQAAFHGHVCLGTISGQAMIQLLLKYYPATTDTGLPLEGVSYQVLGVPGNSDDDAFIYSMDDTAGKRAYVGVGTMVGNNNAGFIRWNSKTNTGTLIVMNFDEQAVLQKFKDLYGFSAYSGISAELKFNKWLVEKLVNEPESLVTILKELEGLTEEQYHYLIGYEPTKGNTIEQAHGLDMDYINSLNLPTATRQNVQYTIGSLTPEQIKQIGIDASEMAINLFQAMGITLEKDDPKLTVLTSAGYVRLNGQTTDMVMDGIYEILGSRLSRATLLPVHTALWKSLVFDFAYNDGSQIITKSISYDPNIANENKLVLGSKANYNIEDVLLYNPPYDALMAWLFHNHVCGGSSPGYLMNDYILENYPLGEDEKYIYVTTSDNCKDDILNYLLGVSAGSGTYYNIRLTSEQTQSPTGSGTDYGILIRWNEKTGIGEVSILNWVGPKFAAGSNSYEEYIRLYNGDYSSPNLLFAPKLSVDGHTWITREELNAIISNANGNALAYIRGLPIRSESDLIKVPGGSQGGGSTSTGTSQGTSSGNGFGAGSSGVSVGATTLTGVSSQLVGPGAQGVAYEVSKVSPVGSDSGLSVALMILGAVLCGGLLIVGFFKDTIFGFLK